MEWDIAADLTMVEAATPGPSAIEIELFRLAAQMPSSYYSKAYNEIRRLREALQRTEAARERLERALKRDQTGLVEALMAVVKAVKARRWILEGRGSYTYNDDQYRKEAGWAFDEIESLATKALRESGKLAFEALT